MAQNAIIENLQRELRLPIRSERQVVYVLAEIRKYIEHVQQSGLSQYGRLRLFCNWVLHTEISRDPGNILFLLEQFDIAEGVSLEDFTISRFNRELKEMLMLRNELTAFLKEHGLPNELVSSEDEWQKFLFLYMLVIADVPLRYPIQLPGHPPYEALVQELTIKYEPHKHRRGTFVWDALTSSGYHYRSVIRYGHYDNEYDCGELPGFFDSVEF